MPQLDIDLFDDFIFFAFVSLLFGVGDDEGEQSAIVVTTASFLANFYIEKANVLIEEEKIVKLAFENSILLKK